MSSSNYETSSLRMDVPYIIGVTRVSKAVETNVSNNPDEELGILDVLDSVK